MENKAKKVTSATISNLHQQPENTDTSMSNFTHSPAKPSTMTEEDKDENEETETIDHSEPKPDSPVSLEQFTTIESSQANDYFKQHVPYYTQMSEHPISSKDELLLN